MWPLLIVAGLVTLAVGCAGRNVVYPGDGTPVAIDLDGPTYDSFRDDVVKDTQKAIAVWTSMGPRFQIGGTADYRIRVHVGLEGPGGSDSEGCYDKDTGEIWTVAGTGGTGTLAAVIAHELGHAIGLEHVPDGVMQASGKIYMTLQPDDIKEYQRVWGGSGLNALSAEDRS